MASRTFGWMQDCGDIKSLKRIVQIFIKNSEVNKDLKDNKIPTFVPERCNKEKMIKLLDEDIIEIPYVLLKGNGCSKNYQLSVEENMKMFGLCEKSAEKMVNIGGRANAACSGIAQACLKAQKYFKTYVPDCLDKEKNIKKTYQSDWATEAFIKWGISLGFLNYNSSNDSCTISDLGIKYATSLDDSEEEKEILSNAYLSYPPVIRILSLLKKNGPMTKFQIGNQFGFIGEAGFTSVPHDYFIFYLNEFPDKHGRANLEGTSDKYVRMICEWLNKLGWVINKTKEHKCIYGGKEYSEKLQTYEITEIGKINLKKSYGYSRYPRIPKRVFCEMLSSRMSDGNYIQSKRATLLHYISKSSRSMKEILNYLESKGYNELESTIIDDIKGFECIGLDVSELNNKYRVNDRIECLEIPKVVTGKSDIVQIKDYIRSKLNNVDHKYLVLIDLAYSDSDNKTKKNSDARDFEIETINLLTKELNFIGIRLGDSDKPDSIISYGKYGTIIDNKSYQDGFNVDKKSADEMSRYIEQNEKRIPMIPTNEWWKQFPSDVSYFTFLFVTSHLKNNFKNNLEYISKMRNIKGAAISVENLLYLAEVIKKGSLKYHDFFELFNNDEIKIDI